MKQNIGLRQALKKLPHDERGAVAIILTIYLPVIAGFMTLATDMSYVYWSRNMLQVTAEAAALAASSQLPVKNNVVTMAKDYAKKNMSVARYGTVLNDADVVLRYWPTTCSNISCSSVSDSAGSCAPNQCNAVQVTTRQTLNLTLASLFGFANFDVTATAIATAGPGAQNKWNALIVEDVSKSFTEEIGDAKKADLALLDCIKQNAAPGSQMGLTVFAEDIKTLRSLTNVGTDSQKVKDAINSLDVCGSTMSNCRGTDLAGGMNSAIDQMCPIKNNKPTCTSSGISGAQQAMIIVTDGQPNRCQGKNCDPKKAAEAAAKDADDKGIDVFTIYYGNNDGDAAWRAGLVRGSGQAFKTPKSSDLANLMVQVCSFAHRLVW